MRFAIPVNQRELIMLLAKQAASQTFAGMIQEPLKKGATSHNFEEPLFGHK